MSYQMILNKNDNNNNEQTKNKYDDWILLINDMSSQSISVDENTTSSSDKSFTTDDALAFKILNDTYDLEAQKPYVIAYPQDDDNCCCERIRSKIRNENNEILGWTTVVSIWSFLGTLFYYLLHDEHK